MGRPGGDIGVEGLTDVHRRTTAETGRLLRAVSWLPSAPRPGLPAWHSASPRSTSSTTASCSPSAARRPSTTSGAACSRPRCSSCSRGRIRACGRVSVRPSRSSSGSSPSRWGSRQNYLRDASLSRDDYTGLLTIPAGLLPRRRRLGDAWRTRKGGSRGSAGTPARRPGCGTAVGTYFVVLPLAQSYVITHTGRASCRRRTSARSTKTSPSPRATASGLGLVHPFQERCGGHRVPRAPGPQKSARLLARHGYGVLPRPARRGEERGRPEPPRLGRDARPGGGRPLPRARPDVEDDRIGGVGLSVGGEMMLQEAAETDGLEGDRGRGRASASCARPSTSTAPRRRSIRGSSVSPRSAPPCSRATCRLAP